MPNVFISWSGEGSKRAAEILHKWLPAVLQTIKPFMSAEDLKKGGRWQADLNAELAKDSVGVICLTPSNLLAPWILFEAGALSKSLGDAQVAPLLLGVKPSDLPPPLTQFNAVFAERSDFKRLILSINSRVTEDSVDPSRIELSLDAMWPRIEAELKAAEEPPQKAKVSRNSDQTIGQVDLIKRFDDILQELLVLNRQQTNMLSLYEGEAGYLRATSMPQLERVVNEFASMALRVAHLSRKDLLGTGFATELLRLEEMALAVSSEASLGLKNDMRRASRTSRHRDISYSPPPDYSNTVPSSLRFKYIGTGAPLSDDLKKTLSANFPVRSIDIAGNVLTVNFTSPLGPSAESSAQAMARKYSFDLVEKG